MGESIKHLSDSELEIMQIIWENEGAVSRSVIEEALPRGQKLAPSTIITFLTRLCEKGYLNTVKKGRTNFYTPLISRQDYFEEENKSFLNRVYRGSISDFAAALCSGGISKKDLEELRRLLEENAL